MRAAGSIVGHTKHGSAGSGAAGDEDNDDGAVNAGSDRIAAVIILNKVRGIDARYGEVCDAQGCGAGIGQGDDLRQTGNSDGLEGKNQTCG